VRVHSDLAHRLSYSATVMRASGRIVKLSFVTRTDRLSDRKRLEAVRKVNAAGRNGIGDRRGLSVIGADRLEVLHCSATPEHKINYRGS